MLLEFQIALKYLKGKKQEKFISVISFLSFFGIMLGVATLIIVMSVMNGFRVELMDRILGINSHISVLSKDGSQKITNYENLVKDINKIPNVDFASSTIKKQALAIFNGNHAGVLVNGVTAKDLAKKTKIANSFLEGGFWKEDENSPAVQHNKIIIGSKMALDMNVRVGDKIMLLLPQMNQTFFASIPKMKEFEVVGVFNVGMIEYDSSFVYIPLSFAKLFFEYSQNEISEIEIFLHEKQALSFVKSQLYLLFQLKYRVLDWVEANSGFVESLNVERNVMFLILTLIVLVAVFNIISSMVMLVNSKKREIAIFSTLGLSSYSIARIFIIVGSFIGILGTLFGVLIGVIFTENIEQIKLFVEGIFKAKLFSPEVYFLSQLPAKLEINSVINIALLSITFSILATIYPAYKAAKKDPVKILKFEE